MSLGLRKQITRNLSNIPGWRTNRKIVVLESDDWGSIRMPSKQVYDNLLKRGIQLDKLSYNRFDSLAGEEDLSSLFEVLSSVKDKNGNPAVLTANTIVANPDFEKIEASNFQDYHYEPFTSTLKRYSQHSNSFELWKQGMQDNIFCPQFHGREHLNVTRWMRALRENIGNVQLAFDYRMFDLSQSNQISEDSFMEALNFESTSEYDFQKKSIIEGLELFEQLFGYRSATFIAPCYTWSRSLHQTLKVEGIKGFQGGWYQFEPIEGKKHKFNKILHYTGQKNSEGQYFLTRNAAFEPSQQPGFDFVTDILSRASIAFRWGKPLIISAHRLNFIGFIDRKNRITNLLLLSKLLKELLNRWPDLDFLSSDQLLNTIIGE